MFTIQNNMFQCVFIGAHHAPGPNAHITFSYRHPPRPHSFSFSKKFPVHSHRTDRFCYDPFLAFLKSFTSHPQVYTAHISKEYIQTFAKTLSPSPSSHKEGIGMDFICYLKLKNMRRIYEVTVFRDGTTGWWTSRHIWNRVYDSHSPASGTYTGLYTEEKSKQSLSST